MKLSKLGALFTDQVVAASVELDIEESSAQVRRLQSEGDVLQQRRALGATRAQLQDLPASCARATERLSGLNDEVKREAIIALGIQMRVWRKGCTPRFIARTSSPAIGQPESDFGLLQDLGCVLEWRDQDRWAA